VIRIFVDALLGWAIRQRLAIPLRLVLATILIAVVAVVRVLWITSLLPWLPFIPVLILIALALGASVGLYATLLAALLAALTIAPEWDLRRLSGDQTTATILFVAVMVLLVYITAELRAAYRRNAALLAEADRTAALIRQREADLALINAELGHRLKNQLTVVQALTTQIIRRSPDVAAAEAAVSERLSLLGRASDLLLAGADQQPELAELIATVIAPLQVAPERIRTNGGRVRLPRDPALALALCLHELATNAVKYGALSNERGMVSITWQCDENADGTTRLGFVWQEADGPTVAKPARRGFGTTLLERALTPYFSGAISTHFHADGLVFEIDATVGPR